MGEEAWDDAGFEGALRGVFRVEEEGVSDAYILNEAVNLFRRYSAGVCAECFAYSIVFEEAQLETGLRVQGGVLICFQGFWRPLDSYV